MAQKRIKRIADTGAKSRSGTKTKPEDIDLTIPRERHSVVETAPPEALELIHRWAETPPLTAGRKRVSMTRLALILTEQYGTCFGRDSIARYLGMRNA